MTIIISFNELAIFLCIFLYDMHVEERQQSKRQLTVWNVLGQRQEGQKE